jgi:hypothetical protein
MVAGRWMGWEEEALVVRLVRIWELRGVVEESL